MGHLVRKVHKEEALVIDEIALCGLGFWLTFFVFSIFFFGFFFILLDVLGDILLLHK